MYQPLIHHGFSRRRCPSCPATRQLPLPLREPLREELDRMVKAGIIDKQDQPTDWVSPLVSIRKKDGKQRLCMDPRKINNCLKSEHYEMLRREDIESELAGARFFTRLDANSGFHQIPLHKEMSRISPFATPFGRYRFLRLPFSIDSAQKCLERLSVKSSRHCQECEYTSMTSSCGVPQDKSTMRRYEQK